MRILKHWKQTEYDVISGRYVYRFNPPKKINFRGVEWCAVAFIVREIFLTDEGYVLKGILQLEYFDQPETRFVDACAFVETNELVEGFNVLRKITRWKRIDFDCSLV